MVKLNKPETPKVGIIGANGWVGRKMTEIFPEALKYDAFYKPAGHDLESGWVKNLSDLKECLYVFVCVPTPSKKNGQCDTSIVRKVIHDLDKEMKKIGNDDAVFIIRSTVEPGTTLDLIKNESMGVVFQPEYLGETPGHPMDFDFVILGGIREDTQRVADLYKTVYDATVRYYFTTPTTAEICKYMENSFIATKVIFCNQFYDLAKKVGADYNELRELWLADQRIGRPFTDVYPNKRGFDGKCLPKDTKAITYTAKKLGVPLKLVENVIKINKEYHA